MLSYLQVLEQAEAFTQVVLVEHEIQDSDPNRPLRFAWRLPGGPSHGHPAPAAFRNAATDLSARV